LATYQLLHYYLLSRCFFFDWSGNKARKGIIRVYQDFNQACFNCLGLRLSISPEIKILYLLGLNPWIMGANWYSYQNLKALKQTLSRNSHHVNTAIYSRSGTN
jgi:hypothetical protein